MTNPNPHEVVEGGGESAGPGASGAGTNKHESVSGGEAVLPGEAGEVFETGGFDGVAASLESVEGFIPSAATKESLLSEEVEVTEDLAALPPVESLVFDEPESVCGADDRVRISPATAIPWRWTCELLITMANGAGARGTGWFIGPRTVMTAGHVVFSAAAGGWATSIEVIPGMDGASRPFGSQVGTSFRSVTGWTVNADPEYDYGAIILPNNNLGNTVGWFGFAALSDADLQNLLVNTAGYPGDKPFGTMWFNAGTVTQVTARRLHYMIDTFGGQSGSSVWRLQNGLRHAVGIHGYGGCPNKAVRIVVPVFNNMLAWKNLGFP
jgi:glutamyl endopeptidase